MPGDDVPYPGDDAILAYRLCAEALGAMKCEDEARDERRKTSRRAMIEDQKKKKAEGRDAQT